MNFIEAIKSCLRKWITFSGRAPRSEFWYFLLFYNIFLITIHFITGYFKTEVSAHTPYILLPAILYYVFALVVLVWVIAALISATVRRLHDVNRSGWWYWIAFTIVGAVFPLFVWYCTKGTDGDNRFGPDPQQPAIA